MYLQHCPLTGHVGSGASRPLSILNSGDSEKNGVTKVTVSVTTIPQELYKNIEPKGAMRVEASVEDGERKRKEEKSTAVIHMRRSSRTRLALRKRLSATGVCVIDSLTVGEQRRSPKIAIKYPEMNSTMFFRNSVNISRLTGSYLI